MSTPLSGPEHAPKSGIVKRVVIFLHGYGSDGADLISLAPLLDLPDTHFLSPNAPFPCELSPYGYQWFSLIDRTPARVLAGVQAAAPILDAFIDATLARFALPPENLALVGFSQGSMMSLYTAPRRADAIAGVVGISGALHGADALAAELKSRPPVCLIHGTADEVVPFAAMGAAEAGLTAHGVAVEAHARPGLGHGIDEMGLAITQTLPGCLGVKHPRIDCHPGLVPGSPDASSA